MEAVLDKSGSLKVYRVPIVLKELEGSYAHRSRPFVRLPVRHCALIFWIFSKSGGLIYCSKGGAKRGNSVGNDF